VSKYEVGERRLDVIEFVDVCVALKVNPVTFLRDLLDKESLDAISGVRGSRKRT
jgi:hypothetical protein